MLNKFLYRRKVLVGRNNSTKIKCIQAWNYLLISILKFEQNSWQQKDTWERSSYNNTMLWADHGMSRLEGCFETLLERKGNLQILTVSFKKNFDWMCDFRKILTIPGSSKRILTDHIFKRHQPPINHLYDPFFLLTSHFFFFFTK